MPTTPRPAVWPVLHYDDSSAALAFLVEAFGFCAAAAARDGDGDVVHAELRWPTGGAVVLGSTKHAGGVHAGLSPGSNACYVVAEDVDAVYERALAAGAAIAQPPHWTEFGTGVSTRAFTARDPEGNLWTFGGYRGAD